MSELKFNSNCQNFELEATANLFSKLSCQAEHESQDEFFMSGIEKLCDDEKLLKLDLEQVQRRQSIVYENAQEKVAVLENLLKTVEQTGWSEPPPKPVATAPQCPPPQAYRFKDIYELKKQQLLRQHIEQERNQREFHSRPMPNFRQVHQQQANKPIVHRITHPVTPNVLKTSRNMLLKRTQRIEQLLQQREQEQMQEQLLRPKTKPVPNFNVIPLKPNNGQSPSQLQLLPPKPFRLSTEIRAEQRKRFNAQTQQMQEQRRRELEEQRKRQEQQEYRKHRQLATFRARPNPFRPQ